MVGPYKIEFTASISPAVRCADHLETAVLNLHFLLNDFLYL